jgi:hypothetical protein
MHDSEGAMFVWLRHRGKINSEHVKSGRTSLPAWPSQSRSQTLPSTIPMLDWEFPRSCLSHQDQKISFSAGALDPRHFHPTEASAVERRQSRSVTELVATGQQKLLFSLSRRGHYADGTPDAKHFPLAKRLQYRYPYRISLILCAECHRISIAFRR